MLKRDQIWIVLVDAIMINAAWLLYYVVRVRTGWISLSGDPELTVPMVFMYAFWFLGFFFMGLYRSWYASSRFDEVASLFKTISLGCLFLFFAVFVDDQGTNPAVSSRLLIILYWMIMLLCTSTGRLMLRSIQRRMLVAGIGAHNTIIVGSDRKSQELYDELVQFPALGYKVVGFTSLEGQGASSYKGTPNLGSINELHDVIGSHNVREVLIALESSDHQHLLEIIARCNSHKVGLKIIPDLYDIISGQARTNQIYGFPLIEISPQLMKPWEEFFKRALDISFSLVVLLMGLPLWILLAVFVKLESPGPILYKQERVGKEGKLFNILKYRSMRQDAEAAGPQWANKKDPRVTRVGYWLRKLHLDEIPQVWNVLRGDMSLVGPRPERPMFVEQLSKEIPLYPRRLKVRPGITGWAQVKHKYDETIEDVRKKVQYDLFYIENMSLRMDIKILLNTISHMLLGRGHT